MKISFIILALFTFAPLVFAQQNNKAMSADDYRNDPTAFPSELDRVPDLESLELQNEKDRQGFLDDEEISELLTPSERQGHVRLRSAYFVKEDTSLDVLIQRYMLVNNMTEETDPAFRNRAIFSLQKWNPHITDWNNLKRGQELYITRPKKGWVKLVELDEYYQRDTLIPKRRRPKVIARHKRVKDTVWKSVSRWELAYTYKNYSYVDDLPEQNRTETDRFQHEISWAHNLLTEYARFYPYWAGRFAYVPETVNETNQRTYSADVYFSINGGLKTRVGRNAVIFAELEAERLPLITLPQNISFTSQNKIDSLQKFEHRYLWANAFVKFNLEKFIDYSTLKVGAGTTLYGRSTSSDNTYSEDLSGYKLMGEFTRDIVGYNLWLALNWQLENLTGADLPFTQTRMGATLGMRF